MTCARPAGFTLIELMIAVAILAIISAIAIPLYQGYVTEARFGTAAKDIRQIQLILDDLALDRNLAALEPSGYAGTELGVYLQPGGQLALAAAAPAGAEPWLDPWGRIYVYQRADVARQDFVLFSQGKDAADTADDVIHNYVQP